VPTRDRPGALSGLADEALRAARFRGWGESSAVARSLYDGSEWVPRRDARSLGGVSFIAWALASAELALLQAGLVSPGVGARTTSAAIDSGDAAGGPGLLLPESDGGHDPCRFGAAVGTGIGCLEEIGRSHALSAAGEHRRISPFFVPRILPNMAAGNVAIRFGLRGPNLAPATACASGSHAIGDAFR